MAVTETEPKTQQSREAQDTEDLESERGHEREAEPEEKSEARERECDREEEPEEKSEGQPQAAEDSEDEPEGSDVSESQEPEKGERKKGIAGGVAVFVALGIYFVWIGNEMGSHAISGTFEMWAIFGAIFLGVIALVAGGAISRRRDED
jgi:cation transport ATPase